MMAGFICEVVMTAMFLFIIMGATDKRAPTGLAPLAIGLTLALIHMISIPVTNTSTQHAAQGQHYLRVGLRLISFGYFGSHRLLAR